MSAGTPADVIALALGRRQDAAIRERPTAADPIHDELLALFDAHARSLRSFVASSGVPASSVDDVVQEAFVALYQHLRRGGDSSNLRAWLFRVCYRQGLKQRRRSWRLLQWQIGWHPGAGLVLGRHADPEARVLHLERCRSVRAVLAAMPERDRQCFLLRAEGFRYRQIAEILGVSLGAVAKSLGRGMAKLSIVLEEAER